ncbi:site-specific DNA-methyltransferase [Calothrix sp. UHCC 0171]|uniref:DNA-methyltransferase n=1 Tax=Calothrix sp. UHCC 0171 TaxID=3110245 RepID=UPI002B1FD881|nr:site-specific DNA-methyltransferase [Calothrix sp. UHCC 0171]MEA5572140.1 site-specific DNA-methyltransferase [Calothrix sp. UHCC 0171]
MTEAQQLPLFLKKYPVFSESFTSNANVILHTGVAENFLYSLPSEIATLIVTSPPYNIGKEYETRRSIERYLAEQDSIIDELVRVLNTQGSLCWQVGNYVQNGEVFPLDIYYYDLFKKRGLKLRNRIIWHFGHGLHASRRFSGRYETLLWFTKSDTYTFNLDSVRVPSKYPGKRHFKGKNKGMPSGNPLGKNPSDIWEIVAHEWEKELWDIPNVKSNHPEKTIHPCQFPVELVERCVLAFTNEDDYILDPFCGVGSSLIAAINHNRQAIGIDKEQRYTNIAKERLKALYRGELKLRAMGKEIYKPTGRERVAQVPEEWRNQDLFEGITES